MPRRHRHLLLAATTLTATLLSTGGCDRKPSGTPANPRANLQANPPTTSTSNAAGTPATPAPAAPRDEVKLSKEMWPNGKLKYSYEMRRGADGKWGRNGIGRAYYDSGELEREGTYKDGVRVGEWKYFDPSGKVLRVEQRGSDGQGAP